MHHLAVDLPLPPRDALTLPERTRLHSDAWAPPPAPEDAMPQSLEDARPPEWHLDHTISFFEGVLPKPRAPDDRAPDDSFALLPNSQACPGHAQDWWGTASRPGDEAVRACRAHVEDPLVDLLDAGRDSADDIAALGRHQEMRPREVLHGPSFNPLLWLYAEPKPLPVTAETNLCVTHHEGGPVEAGHNGSGVAYDCKGPRPRIWLDPCEIADRSVTNCDWTLFMEDDGPVDSRHWLTEDHKVRAREGWDAPLFWWRQDDEWRADTLLGPQPVSLEAPVCNVSYREADALARWSGARLPTEAEHEVVFRAVPPAGDFLEDGKGLGLMRPKPGAGIWDDVWQWTVSPGFTAPEGALGDHEGSSMDSQRVLRESSCVTPSEQMLPTSCSVSDAHQRRQMTGLRLARNVT